MYGRYTFFHLGDQILTDTVFDCSLVSFTHPRRLDRTDDASSLDALIEALDALDDVCGVIDDKYTEATNKWNAKHSSKP